MSNPPANRRRLMIVPRRRNTRLLLAGTGVLWALSLVAAVLLTERVAAPGLDRARGELAETAGRLSEAEARIDKLRERVAVLKRSDQVSRAANQLVQGELAERDEQIAQLRADVAFYERLVGGSGQRQGLAVHSLSLRPGTDGAQLYTLTLTQNLKKAKVSKGEVTMRIDGVRDGKLDTLEWAELLQRPEGAPAPFSFKYFQQLEGSIMLPPGFIPHRVWVRVKSDGGSTEQSFPWEATQTHGA